MVKFRLWDILRDGPHSRGEKHEIEVRDDGSISVITVVWDSSSCDRELRMGLPPVLRTATSLKDEVHDVVTLVLRNIPIEQLNGAHLFVENRGHTAVDKNSPYPHRQWVFDPRKLAEEAAGKKRFARMQQASLLQLGFSPGVVNRIFRHCGPGCAVAAASWVVKWIDDLVVAAEGDHNSRYAHREYVLTVIRGLVAPRWRAPAHRMVSVLRAAGAPQGFPGSYEYLVRFLKAAEEAALAYFRRGGVADPRPRW